MFPANLTSINCNWQLQYHIIYKSNEMKTLLSTFSKKIRQNLLSFILLCVPFAGLHAQLAITVNGQATGVAIEQGATLHWVISGLMASQQVTNQLWLDKDENNIINPTTDILFIQFTQVDGLPGSQGPGDDDGAANGVITTQLGGEYFPVAKYIFKTIVGSNSAQALFTETPLQTISYTIGGRVTQGGNGVADIVVQARKNSGSGEYFALTDAMGYYTMNTNVTSGSAMEIEVPTDPFNTVNLAGLIVSPNRINATITSNITNANFIVLAGKVITGTVKDASNNPLAGFPVGANPPMGGDGYYGATNSNGVYYLTVDTGNYLIQFGDNENLNGYVLTYYNQKYLHNASDIVNVPLSVDSVKNINATIQRGGLITGTFRYNGNPTEGEIVAYSYTTPNTPLYQIHYNGNNSTYQLCVPPGTYAVYFQRNGSSTGLYYNNANSWPGTAVVINNVSDVIPNINVNFTEPLAVHFTAVNAVLKQQTVQIEWSIAAEQNEKEYQIERSTDCILFTTIGTQVAIGRNSYAFVDACPVVGINFYRIKAIATDGAITYSRMVNLNVNAIKNDIVVRPNPISSGFVTIYVADLSKPESFTITSLEGKRIQQGWIINTQQQININALTAGTYALKIGNRKAVVIIKQ
jgi:hypothetical protein